MNAKDLKSKAAERSLVTPIYQTSVFGFNTVDEMIAAFDGSSPDYIYTRISNPGIVAAEKTMGRLENAADSVVFASGLAASFAVFSTLLKPGDEVIVSRDLYGGTIIQMKEFLEQWSIKLQFVDLTEDPEKRLTEITGDHTKLIFFETPTNPTLKIVDIEAVVRFARAHTILVAVDNTFASPVNQKPLNSGVDLVTHSATKFLGGHDDLTAGVVLSNNESLLTRIRRYRTYAGAVLDPNSAFLLERGLKTLEIRMAKHNENAATLAAFLQTHKFVKQVYYPGGENSQGHQIAKKQMTGFGGMLSFEIDADLKRLNSFISTLKTIRLIPSLGGVETTVLIPAYSSHFFMPEADKKASGISTGLIRVNVGIEPVEQIISEFSAALDAASS